MQLARPSIARHPFRFGQGRTWSVEDAAPAPGTLGDDLRLFAMTFLGGFLFVSILIG
jgi:hypothetical protein